MREIKLRCWDGEKMWDVLNICFHGRPMVTVQYNPVIKYQLEDVELMQYSGVDFKDIPVDEGDIVEWTTPSQYPQRDIVVFENGYFGLKGDGESLFNYKHLTENCNGYDFKVIGNKFENPELLPELLKEEQ